MDKRAYIDRALAELNEWRAQVGLLKAKLNKRQVKARVESRAKLDEANAKLGALERRVDNARDSAGDAWDDLKTGIEDAFKDLRKAVNRAKGRVD